LRHPEAQLSEFKGKLFRCQCSGVSWLCQTHRCKTFKVFPLAS
jgi:hypothetical protein